MYSSLDTMAETGTIAGIVSAVGMALVGAVSGYISYQKKKLCFSIQRKETRYLLNCSTQLVFVSFVPYVLHLSTESLNADMVKADAPDAVVAQEPQGTDPCLRG